jgi:hypothetical protein
MTVCTRDVEDAASWGFQALERAEKGLTCTTAVRVV